jgi:phosphoglycolate phosphatase
VKVRQAGVLFDLDGTLVDTAPSIARAVNQVLQERQLACQPAGVVRGWIGGGVEHLLRQAMHSLGLQRDDSAGLRELVQRFRVHYGANLGEGAEPYPGMPALLAQLHEEGMPLAIVTNKPREFALPLLESLQLAGLFRSIVCGDDLPRNKPDPMPVLAATTALGIAPAQSWMIGDSLADVAAANSAGCTSVLMAYGYGSDDPQARAQACLHALHVDELRALLYPR